MTRRNSHEKKSDNRNICGSFYDRVLYNCTSTENAGGTGDSNMSADDFLKIEDNPSGSYYLTKDITVPANTSLFTKWDKQFKGTLDGKGHKIKGYTYSAGVYTDYASLFVYAKNATFKNLTLSNVNISLKKSGKASALAAYPTKCTFSNITVSGKITVSGTTSSASGVVALANGKCTFTKCVNKAVLR